MGDLSPRAGGMNRKDGVMDLIETEALYKALGKNGHCCNGGVGVWSLPRGDQPGDWMPRLKGDLVPCSHGYHLCKAGNLLTWLNQEIFVVEARGSRREGGDYIIVAEARLLRSTKWDAYRARLFAADCAAHVLPLFERVHPGDVRPRIAIEAARAARAAAWVAAGGVAEDAAWDAATAAAESAARHAAFAAARAAEGVAWDAATAAAESAAEAAAWDGAGAAERAWQVERLTCYLHAEQVPEPIPLGSSND